MSSLEFSACVSQSSKALFCLDKFPLRAVDVVHVMRLFVSESLSVMEGVGTNTVDVFEQIVNYLLEIYHEGGENRLSNNYLI